MRRLLCVLAAALAVPAPAHAADAVVLGVTPGLVRYGGQATLVGSITPAAAGEPVSIREGAKPVWTGVTEVDGSFAATIALHRAARYVAVAGPSQSPPAWVRVRAVLHFGVRGPRVLGSRILVLGRVLPHQAGRIVVRAGGRSLRVPVRRSGRFRLTLPAPGPAKTRIEVVLRPARGYVRVARSLALHVKAPALAPGAHGPAVAALEQRLRDLRYAVRGVDRYYGGDTRDAVFAFQKLHGLPRTGRVDGRVWAALRGADVPAAGYGGSHIEVYKGRQVVLEVRDGRVTSIVHASTGATGNTPLGVWHVYRKVWGWDWILWYPLYFHRGFALHGYPSVPAWPASHGCVRLPMWFAPSFHARWARGATVRILP